MYEQATSQESNSDFEKERLNNWHQWRGPLADGLARRGNPPIEWDDKKNVRWKAAIEGEGISTPIVWRGKVFFVSAVETGKVPTDPPIRDSRAMTAPPKKILDFTVWCIDFETGETVWKKVAVSAAPHEGRHQTSSYAAASPTTDGKNLLVSFGSYGVFCFDLDGNLVWERDLGDMRTRRGWGEAVSPVIHNGRAIIMWDQEDQSSVFVLDLVDGKTIWKKDRDEPTTWATPLVVTANGKQQLVTNGTNQVISYNLEDGNVIWQTSGTTLNAIPSPIAFGKQVICMSGYRGNRAISVDSQKTGEISESEINWQIERGTPYVPSPLLSDNRLYFTKSNTAILNCINAKTGEPFYEPVRLPGLKSIYASPVAVGGHVYLPGRGGTILVFADDVKFKVVATNKMDDAFDASPVVVGNNLLLRGHKFLYCISKDK